MLVLVQPTLSLANPKARSIKDNSSALHEEPIKKSELGLSNREIYYTNVDNMSLMSHHDPLTIDHINEQERETERG